MAVACLSTDLLPSHEAGDYLPSASARWYAVEVRTRREKAVTSILANKGFEVFLPLYKVRRKWSDRIKTLDAPLFPGYLFTRLVDGQRYLPLLTTPFVRGLVSIGSGPTPIPDEEISAIQAVIASKLPATPWPYLRSGSRVRIIHGPLAGLEGIFLSFKHQDRLILSIEMLQRSVAVEIESAWTEPILSTQDRAIASRSSAPVR